LATMAENFRRIIGLVLTLYLFSDLCRAALLVGEQVTCPDGNICPEGNTCCLRVDGKYGCCPQEKAVCCSDKIHCCPESMTCDLDEGRCEPTINPTQPQWVSKFLSLIKTNNQQKPVAAAGNQNHVSNDVVKPIQSQLASVRAANVGASIVYCPDRRFYCQDGYTCCLSGSGQWICCGLPSATCCQDGYHCCPYGYRCDPTSSYCYNGDGRTVFLSIITGGQKV